MMDISYIIFTIIVFISYTIGTVTGFGSTILALTLGIHLFSIDQILPAILPLNIMLNLYILIRHPEGIQKNILFKKVLPYMSLGFIAGIMLFRLYVNSPIIKTVFGIMIVILSLHEIRLLLSKKNSIRKPIPGRKSSAYIFFAGIIHGIFAASGPFIAYTIGKMELTKNEFRSTLPVLWVILNSILVISYIFTGMMKHETIKLILILLPVVITGIVVGEKIHTRINEHIFKVVVFSVLVLAGLSIIIR